MRKTNTWGGKAFTLLLAALMALTLISIPTQASETIIISNYGPLQTEAAKTANDSAYTIIKLDNDITESNTTVLTVGRDLTLDLNGKKLTINVSSGNGINISNDVTLTIQDSGSNGALEVSGGRAGAGINTTGATLIINSGTVNATGGANTHGAGIGGSGGNGNNSAASGGKIVINGGNVSATGGGSGAGIGGGGHSGASNSDVNAGHGGDITIKGGTITAKGGSGSGAGIGGGGSGSSAIVGNGGNITILGGTIIATAGTAATNNVAAAIGGGSNTNDGYGGDGTIKISLANYRYWTNNTTADPGDEGNIHPDTHYVHSNLDKYVKIAGLPSAPLNFTTTPGDSQVALSWNAPASTGGLNHVIEKYEVSSDDVDWVDAQSNTSHTFEGLANGTEYTFHVRAINVNGNGPAATETATPADTTPPTVTALTPINGATNVAVSGNIIITFNEPMDTTPGTVQLNSAVLSGGLWSGTVFTVSYAGLAYGTAYTVNISGFKDVAGNTMADNNSNSFTTADDPGSGTTHTITASAGTGGSITPSGSVSVNYGDNQAFTITPTSDYAIAAVRVDGVNNPAAVSSGSYTFTNVTRNHTITANFILSTIETDEKETKNVFNESEAEEVISAIDTDLGFDNSDFVYDETSRKIFINEEIVKEIIAKLIEDEENELTEEYTDFVSLGVVSADVAEGNIAQVRIPNIGGAAFGVSLPEKIKLLKITSRDEGVLLNHAATYADFDDGRFTLEKEGALYSDGINLNDKYDLVVFIKDGGDYDLDGDADGKVIDPLVIVNAESSVNPPNPSQPNPNPSPNPSQPTPGNGGMGGGGGCDSSAGMFGLLALLSALFFARRTFRARNGGVE